MTKPTIRLERPAKTDQPAHLCSLIIFLADRKCLLQPSDYSERNKQELLPYWVDVQADQHLSMSNRSYCRCCYCWLIYFQIKHSKAPDKVVAEMTVWNIFH